MNLNNESGNIAKSGAKVVIFFGNSNTWVWNDKDYNCVGLKGEVVLSVRPEVRVVQTDADTSTYSNHGVVNSLKRTASLNK